MIKIATKWKRFYNSFNYIKNSNIDYLNKCLESSDNLTKINSWFLNDTIDNVISSISNDTPLEKTISSINNISNKYKLDVNSNLVYSQIINIYDLLDKGNCGFWLGDLNFDIIYSIRKLLPSLIKNEIDINDFYKKLSSFMANNEFKIPINGILNNKNENNFNLFQRQLIIESLCNDIAIEKFLSTFESLNNFEMAHQMQFSKGYISKWFPDMVKLIKEEQEKILSNDDKYDDSYNYFFLKLSPEKLSLISLTELMKCITKFLGFNDSNDESFDKGFIISKELFENIGKQVSLQISFEDEEKKLNEKTKNIVKENKNNKNFMETRLKKKILDNLSNKLKKNINNEKNHILDKNLKVKIGSILTFFLKEITKIKLKNGLYSNLITLSYTKYKSKIKYIGILKINEWFINDLLSQIEKEKSLFIQLDRSLPMIIKPNDWKDFEIGGYYFKPTNLIRVNNSNLYQKISRYANMDNSYKILNLISSVPWKINKKILNVVEELWEIGGGVGSIPKKYDTLLKNKVYDYMIKEAKNNSDKIKLLKKLQLQRDVYSLRCDFILKLSVAKSFKDVKNIYFPHNMDFRGRIYPIPPHLNHMSNDICRGLLEFSKGKKLGKSGFRWLKIHLANKMGKDKLPNEERVKFTEDNIEYFKKVVSDPLENNDWLELEDCWQSLSAMFDFVAALESGDPENYVSHIHIHQDGSFNGLQHYAALGRDFNGAYQVNLIDRDKPGDLYTHISLMINEKLKKIIEDTSHKNYMIAKKLYGNVKRKTIKQTVMTTVYGVTFIGAKKQIYKQIKDKDFVDKDDDRDASEISKYLAKLTLESVENLFTQAHEIKKWLKECAKLIVLKGHSVSWMTDLGIPVIQPYKSKNISSSISTIMQSVEVNENDENVF